MTVHFTDAQLDDMVKKYVAGATVLDLSQEYGIHNSGVTRRLRLRGVQIRKPGKRAKHVNPQETP